MALIHPTAIVDAAAELGAGVEVGPYAVIGAGVQIGDGTTVGPCAWAATSASMRMRCWAARLRT